MSRALNSGRARTLCSASDKIRRLMYDLDRKLSGRVLHTDSASAARTVDSSSRSESGSPSAVIRRELRRRAGLSPAARLYGLCESAKHVEIPERVYLRRAAEYALQNPGVTLLPHQLLG